MAVEDSAGGPEDSTRGHLAFAAVVLLLGLVLSGCFRDIDRDVRSLDVYTESTIIVHTRDGWKYKFAGGEYTLTTDSSLRQVLQGQAKKYRGNEAQVTDFYGGIPLDHIRKVTETETTPWLYITLGTLVGVTGVLIWIAISFHGLGSQ